MCYFDFPAEQVCIRPGEAARAWRGLGAASAPRPRGAAGAMNHGGARLGGSWRPMEGRPAGAPRGRQGRWGRRPPGAVAMATPRACARAGPRPPPPRRPPPRSAGSAGCAAARPAGLRPGQLTASVRAGQRGGPARARLGPGPEWRRPPAPPRPGRRRWASLAVGGSPPIAASLGAAAPPPTGRDALSWRRLE